MIDADNVAFASAASAEDNDEGIAIARARDMVERIIDQSGGTEYELWLSGPVNFRYSVYPEYKANRIDSYRPRHEKAVRQYFMEEWAANLSDGCEADDMIGVRMGQYEDAVACHLDKDIDMIPGKHFNWEINRLGKVVRPAINYIITDQEGIYNFYYQLLIGDPTDHIKGVPGIGPRKAERILAKCVNEKDMFESVRDQFSCMEEMELNAKVVWIWRKLNDDITERFKELDDTTIS